MCGCLNYCKYEVINIIYIVQLLFSAAVSLNLAKAGLCELLIQLLEKHKNLADDVDTKNLFKMACDLIIIILNDG